jgi:uncharacterized membrane protein YfcA
VPILVYLLDQSAVQATTGSLVVVGVTAMLGAITAYRAGNVLLGRGVAFGVVAIGGAVLGGHASILVPQMVLMASFAMLMLVVGGLMTWRQLDHSRRAGRRLAGRPALDGPIITFTPAFACACPRALKVLITATVVGLLTGFLGVGGGFLVVPALALALALPIRYAAGTSLVVITITSAAALAVRAGSGVSPDWDVVFMLTVVSAAAAVVGARFATRVDSDRLSAAFTLLVLGVAFYTATQAVPASSDPVLPQVAPSRPLTKENHHVPTRHLQDLRQDHLGRLRPARCPGLIPSVDDLRPSRARPLDSPRRQDAPTAQARRTHPRPAGPPGSSHLVWPCSCRLDPDQDSALAPHALAVPVPVVVLTCQPAVVVDQRLHGLGKGHHFGLSLNEDPFTEEPVAEDAQVGA